MQRTEVVENNFSESLREMGGRTFGNIWSQTRHDDDLLLPWLYTKTTPIHPKRLKHIPLHQFFDCLRFPFPCSFHILFALTTALASNDLLIFEYAGYFPGDEVNFNSLVASSTPSRPRNGRPFVGSGPAPWRLRGKGGDRAGWPVTSESGGVMTGSYRDYRGFEWCVRKGGITAVETVCEVGNVLL